MNLSTAYELKKQISVEMKKGFVFTMYIIVLLILFSSCQNKTKNHVIQLVREWEGKEIQFPPNSVFTIQGKDTIEYFGDNSSYKIVTYIDSIGCTSCKLQLQNWKDFILKIASLNHDEVSFLFYFHPKDKSELCLIFRRDSFEYPICLDENDSFNKLNHFPMDMTFQTFLLDKENKVLAIGNPVHNPKVKELYLKIIRGDKPSFSKNGEVKTEAVFDRTSISLGRFDWREEQKVTFTLKNVGDKPLVIEEVDYPKEPAQSGKDLVLAVTYKAERQEYFNKTITVYCNAETSPVKLTISGDAE